VFFVVLVVAVDGGGVVVVDVFVDFVIGVLFVRGLLDGLLEAVVA
jgi:hypothetical protein